MSHLRRFLEADPAIKDVDEELRHIKRDRDADARELEWWRSVFACRFQSDNLPKPGTPLYGYRFRLMVEVPAGKVPGEMVEVLWSNEPGSQTT